MGYREKYDEWVKKAGKYDFLAEELASIKDNDAEIEDRFHKDLSFGTAGLRGKIGAGTNRMNYYTVGKATQGIADFIVEHGKAAMEKGVVIAHDPRHFSREFCVHVAEIFAGNGIKVYMFPSLRPTPELAYLVRRLKTMCGVNITASHNPREYNGYKVYWEDGCQVSTEIADLMTAKIDAVDMWEGVKKQSYDEAVKEGLINILGEEYDNEYLDLVEKLAIHEGDELDLTIPIVYTPLNGCGAIPFAKM